LNEAPSAPPADAESAAADPVDAAVDSPATQAAGATEPPARRDTGSLGRRMAIIAAAWITILLGIGGFTLDRVLVAGFTSSFDSELEEDLQALIRIAEVDEAGRVRLIRDFGESAYITPYSGRYWQIDGGRGDPLPSSSLWDRTLKFEREPPGDDVRVFETAQFRPEILRVAEQAVVLPGSETTWVFRVARARNSTEEGVRTTLDEQIASARRIIVRSFALLGLGLIVLAVLQTIYGLWPLRRLRASIAAMRQGEQARIADNMPREVAPVVDELNALVAHNEVQAEEARRHAGNLAHALKTPLTVIMNAATARDPDLADLVIRESATMRRQVDHHLARARAVGRRGAAQARAEVWPSVDAVERAVSRIYPNARLDSDGDRSAVVRMERQDLDEILGNLVENAAKYGGGSVFVTVEGGDPATAMVSITVEDDGRGISEADRARLFDRGVRLDTSKPGTGLGLAIVRDVVEIYGGTVTLGESEDLGGLSVCIRLPAA
jgi:signal transduction histidine kinase